MSACQTGEFIVGNECKGCDEKCNLCYGWQVDQCTYCNLNENTLLGYYLLNTTCLDSCPDGYYPEELTRTCETCRPECLTCTSYDYCTECIPGPYQLNDGECSEFLCLSDQYLRLTPELSCFFCDYSCLTC